MKFSSGVDALAKENKFLRQLIGYFSCLIACLMAVIAVLYARDPVTIERSVRGLEVVRTVAYARTDADLKEAIGLMMRSRFNTENAAPDIYLSKDQALLRTAEQKELKAQNMFQTVIVRHVDLGKDQVTLDMDRVISVGELRSATKVKMKISFDETDATELNPYGLLLSSANPIDPPKEH